MNGDPQAFEQLFECYADELIRLGYFILANPADAEDVVQDVLISFVESLRSGSFRSGNGTIGPYLRKSVRNRCIDRIRQQRNFYCSLEDGQYQAVKDFVETPLQPSEALDDKRLLAFIEQGIRKLPPVQRAVIVMRIFDELPYSDIAKELGISVDYVKNLLARGRKRLRVEISSVMKGL